MPGEAHYSGSSPLDRWLRCLEHLIYIVIAGLLILAAGTLLVAAVWEFVRALWTEEMGRQVLRMLEKLLLVLMLAELLHTVRVSLHAHGLLPEPFLIVGLIAAMRRVLVITAEAWHMEPSATPQFDQAMLELGLLTVLTLVLVVSIILLHRFRGSAADWRAENESARTPGT
jgi:phosphate starvation-inducible membrane PsiE